MKPSQTAAKPCPHQQKLRQLLSKNSSSNQSISIKQDIIVPQLSKSSIDGIQLNVPDNYLMSLSENKKYLYVLFACQDSLDSMRQSSKIVVWEFRKDNGQNREIELKGIKGVVSAMRFDMIRVQELSLMTMQTQSNNHKSQVKYKFCIILGTQEGSVKIIELQKQNSSSIKSTKLATKKKIVQIQPFSSQENTAFYLFLLQNNQIQLINIANFDVILKLIPVLLRSQVESALCLIQSSFHPELLYQATKGGYLIVWELDLENINLYVAQSRRNMHKLSKQIELIQPRFISHQLSLCGILYMHVLGQLVFIVDKKCVLRFYSINLQDRMDYVQVLTIQLPYFDHLNSIIPNEQLTQDKLYDQSFENTYLNFKWIQNQSSLYFMLQRDQHSVYRLKVNEWSEVDKLQKIKIKNKHFKTIDQFEFNETGQFLVVRNKIGFAIKYFQEEKEQQNKRGSYNREKQKKTKLKRQEQHEDD